MISRCFVPHREGKHSNQYKGAQSYLLDSKRSMVFVAISLSSLIQCDNTVCGKAIWGEMQEEVHRARHWYSSDPSEHTCSFLGASSLGLHFFKHLLAQHLQESNYSNDNVGNIIDAFLI